MGARSLLLLAALSAVACGTRPAKVSSLNVKVEFADSVVVDQLRFEVTQDGQPLFPAASRPAMVGGPLASGGSVAIILPARALGRTVSLRVVGLYQGQEVTAGHSDDLAPLADRPIDVTVRIGHEIESLSVAPTSLSLPLGAVKELKLSGTFIDGTSGEVGEMGVWSTADPSIATVDTNAGTRGLVTAVKEGSTIVSAVIGDQRVDVPVTVTPRQLVKVSVSPSALTLARGTTQVVRAVATWSDGQMEMVSDRATWMSSDGSTVSVDATGMLSAIKVGNPVTISATFMGMQGAATVFVVQATLQSIVIEPSNAQVAAGYKQQFLAFGVFSDGSTMNITSSSSWAVSDTSRATVSKTLGEEGLLSALAAGAIEVSATSQGVTGKMPAMITNATLVSLGISPSAPAIAKGTKQAFTATGTYSDNTTADLTTQVVWGSSDGSIATIASSGVASGAGVGTATISARAPLGMTATTTLKVTAATLRSIAVTPTAPSLAKGTKLQLTATGTYSDDTTQDLTGQVTWASTDSTVVSVARGLASALKKGQATVSATLGSLSGSTQVSVTDAILDSITITPSTPSLAVGNKVQLTATGTYSDSTTQDLTPVVSWVSESTTVATVANGTTQKGVLTALSVGMARVRADLNGVSGATTATVTPAVLTSIAVTPTNPGVPLGTTLNMMATGTYSDGSSHDLTTQVVWSTNNSNASVDNSAGSQGLLKGLAKGTATVSARAGSGTSAIAGSTTVTVNDAVLMQIAVTPGSTTLAKGLRAQLTAKGTYSDGTVNDISGAVTWLSSNVAAVTVSNGSDIGTVTAVDVGSATIGARLSGISGSASVMVAPASLSSIAISPANSALIEGTSEKLSAFGTYSDGSMRDITAQVSWRSSNEAVVVISSAAGSEGVAKGLVAAADPVPINASLGGVMGTGTIAVRAATLTSIDVSPGTGSVAAGFTQQFSALGHYSNGTSQDVTKGVQWGSGDANIATVANAAGSEGLATGVMAGASTSITATFMAATGNIVGTATLNVTAAVPTGLTVSPSAAKLAVGDTQQLAALEVYSDNSTVDVTKIASWASGDDKIATVDGTGMCMGQNAGSVKIVASYGGYMASATLDVQ